MELDKLRSWGDDDYYGDVLPLLPPLVQLWVTSPTVKELASRLLRARLWLQIQGVPHDRFAALDLFDAVVASLHCEIGQDYPAQEVTSVWGLIEECLMVVHSSLRRVCSKEGLDIDEPVPQEMLLKMAALLVQAPRGPAASEIAASSRRLSQALAAAVRGVCSSDFERLLREMNDAISDMIGYD